MGDVKWIKLDVGIFEDEKIRLILAMPEGKTLLFIWLKLLCLAGRVNNNGMLTVNKTIPYTDEMLSAVFGEQDKLTRLALDTFARLGMVERFKGTLLLTNWQKHQSTDKLREIQEHTAARVAKYREKQRLQADGNVTVTLQERIGNADVTQQNKNKNENKNENQNENQNENENQNQNQNADTRAEGETAHVGPAKPSRARAGFTVPTAEDVRAYCLQRGNSVDAERFVDYYAMKGWMIRGDKLKDWKAAVRTWEKNGYANGARAEPKREYLDTDGRWD